MGIYVFFHGEMSHCVIKIFSVLNMYHVLETSIITNAKTDHGLADSFV